MKESLRLFLLSTAFLWTTALASPVFDIDDDGGIPEEEEETFGS